MSSRAIVSNRFVDKQRKPPKRLTNLAKYKKQIITEETARLNAKYKWKQSKRGMTNSLTEHLGKLVDKIEPFDAVAILGITVLVKGTIDASEELVTKISKPLYVLGLISPIFIPFLPLAGFGVSGKLKEIPDWQEWILSFAIAYILVKHGGQLFGLLGGGLKSIITLFLT